MSIDFLSIALLVISVLTGLAVEGIKKVLDKTSIKCSSNVIAAISSIVVSIASSIVYLIVTDTAVSLAVIVEIIALVILSFLVSTVGYDKVMQTLKQLMTYKDDSEDNSDSNEE
ncbi:MAG: hypothetical protein LUD27_04840 [Clostridia bacterium]|nr:hypothetical protein [Clostridia bacterium]